MDLIKSSNSNAIIFKLLYLLAKNHLPSFNIISSHVYHLLSCLWKVYTISASVTVNGRKWLPYIMDNGVSYVVIVSPDLLLIWRRVCSHTDSYLANFGSCSSNSTTKENCHSVSSLTPCVVMKDDGAHC